MKISENQLLNIVNFYFNFNKDCDINISGLSPGYIKEKWSCHIGAELETFYFDLNDVDLNTWKSMWSIDDEDKKILTLYQLILDLNSLHFDKTNLKFIFDKIKPLINLNKVSQSVYDSLHTTIKMYRDIWLRKKSNERYIKLIKLEIEV